MKKIKESEIIHIKELTMLYIAAFFIFGILVIIAVLAGIDYIHTIVYIYTGLLSVIGLIVTWMIYQIVKWEYV